MKILVTGGRDYADYEYLSGVLDGIHSLTGIDMIIEGGARGADSLARKWAITNYIPFKTYEADWKKYGKSAGHKRNRRMLDDSKADMVVAFSGGVGTAGMVAYAWENLVPVLDKRK